MTNSRDLGTLESWTDPLELTTMLVELRDSLSRCERVRWRAQQDAPAYLVRLLHHLAPPEGPGPGLSEWRHRHEYGLLYYRMGPDFVLVRENRGGLDGALYEIYDPELVACFLAHYEPTQQPHMCARCSELLDAELTLALGSITVALPQRLRYPPVPFLSV